MFFTENPEFIWGVNAKVSSDTVPGQRAQIVRFAATMEPRGYSGISIFFIAARAKK